MTAEWVHLLVKDINYILWEWEWIGLISFLLVATGVFYTIRSRGVQFRLFAESIRALFKSRNSVSQSLTSFQAFVVGLASRVGVGNIAGVAIAIHLGGPGAVFWMWLVAVIGMSSAFAESSLAQLFKVDEDGNGHFRGGPAYYILKAMNSKWLAIAFALSLIFAYGFVFNAVQSNSIAQATLLWNIPTHYVGIFLVLITMPIIFGGIKRISQAAEWLVPIMAIFYLALALWAIGMNWRMLPDVLLDIIRSAFGWEPAGAGVAGGMIAVALQNGIRRGLYSNEGGMGSAPNAAATAHVAHPVNQGLIQMLGVAIDTLIVCSCTAALILLSGVYNQTNELNGVQLTLKALDIHFGPWGVHFLVFLIFIFAYSTIIGNYAYAESNIQFIKKNPKLLFVFRIAVLCMVFFGTIEDVPLVWDMADMAMGFMAGINLIALLCLSRYVMVLINDYMKQLKEKKSPVFYIEDHPEIADKVGYQIWSKQRKSD